MAERQMIPYGTDELMAVREQRRFSGTALREIAFPIGGIGAGCISLGGRGQLRDWEIFNRPNMGYRPAHTFVTLRAQADGEEPVVKVAETASVPPFSSTHGYNHVNGEGLPHLDSARFRGEYPFAWIEFADSAMPVKLSMEAFNPFMPLEPDDSGLPLAVLTYRLRNTSRKPVDALLVFSIQNVVGLGRGADANRPALGGNRNVFRSADGLKGLFLDSVKHPADSPQFGNMVVATPCEEVTYTGSLTEHQDAFTIGHAFWDAVANRGGFENVDLQDPTEDGRTAVGALGVQLHLQPDQQQDVTFLLAWYFPNFLRYFGRPDGRNEDQWKNHYATRFKSAWEVAAYSAADLERLRGKSLAYHDALFGSSLPAVAIDAASANTSTLKTCSCLRLADGTFYGFEGCSASGGCCHGSCTHVWNYQQALAFLFPSLERSMRAADYMHNLRKSDGRMCFRIELPLGNSDWEFHAAADGQLGGIIKTYRDWQLCGDDDWLRGLWPRVKKALAYAWEQWDADRDGLCEGVQHNTYDIELVGPNPLIGGFYMGALRAAEEMARHLGEEDLAEEYRDLFEKGSRKTDDILFNGEYYVQEYDPEKVRTQQFGEGCLSDQMLGQWLAAICDLGYLFEPENVHSALRSVFDYNWRASLAGHANVQRIYALADEAGLLMASWPFGNRPLIPTRYCDEVWTGIEYQVASHLIMEGMVEEGLAIVRGARDRHDGVRRNPWDEFECGSHYARAMSSWGLILALSGYFCDASRGLMRFDPQVRRENFRCFWSSGTAWGIFRQKLDEGYADMGLDVLHGEQQVRTLQLELDLPEGEEVADTKLDGEVVQCSAYTEGEWTELRFASPVVVADGSSLSVHLEA